MPIPSNFEDFCHTIISNVHQRLDERTPTRFIRWYEVLLLLDMGFEFGIDRKCVTPLWMIPEMHHWRLVHVEGEPEGCHKVCRDDGKLAKKLYAYRMQYDHAVEKGDKEALATLQGEIEEELYRENFSCMLKIYYGWMA